MQFIELIGLFVSEIDRWTSARQYPVSCSHYDGVSNFMLRGFFIAEALERKKYKIVFPHEIITYKPNAMGFGFHFEVETIKEIKT